ncbi:MAG: GAF domain-containing sensor histidine kinase [Candidatus Latescibacterota bacterium]
MDAASPLAGDSPRADLIPLERELRERVAWFIRLRWLAVGGIAAGAWGATTFVVPRLPALPLYGVALAVAGYNAVFALLLHRWRPGRLPARAHRRLLYLQIALDWVALICLVHYAGGIHSPVALAFTFHLILGAILLSRRACYAQVALASLLAGTLLVVEQTGAWTPVAARPPLAVMCIPERCLEGCIYRWLALTVFFGVVAFLVTSVTVPLRRKEEALFASEQALDRAYGELGGLYRVAQAVNATLDPEKVLALIARNAARLMGLKACSIRLLETDGRLRIGAAYGLSQAYLDKGPVEVSRSRLDAEALAGRIVQVEDAAQDPRFQYPEEARREGIHSVLCAPMQARGRAIGCIRVYADVVRPFSGREEEFLGNLASLGAVAIDNARAYQAVQAHSEERAWFARMTHHQLRGPLAATAGMLDAMRYAGPLADKQHELVERSRRRIGEVLEMIRDLLDLAAAQRPLAGGPAEPVSLAGAVQPALDSAGDRAAHKGVALNVELAADAWVLADAEDVARIFANLLDNAVKYTPAGGTVAFAAAMAEGWVEARVRDSGIGIEPQDRERVFRGFYRSPAARATGEAGTGMGLSIVRRLVERWGGSVDLESQPEAGSCFAVRMPAAAHCPGAQQA